MELYFVMLLTMLSFEIKLKPSEAIYNFRILTDDGTIHAACRPGRIKMTYCIRQLISGRWRKKQIRFESHTNFFLKRNRRAPYNEILARFRKFIYYPELSYSGLNSINTSFDFWRRNELRHDIYAACNIISCKLKCLFSPVVNYVTRN